VSAPTIDPATPAAAPRKTGVARWIRRLAVPIIVGWVALIVALTLSVPQLETVGQMRSVSMSPKEAPSRR
jgi:putative drug exporter of the RND superfamily